MHLLNKKFLTNGGHQNLYESKTKVMEFKVGGRRFYAMVSPEGQAIGWQVQEYTSITPKTNFKYCKCFC